MQVSVRQLTQGRLGWRHPPNSTEIGRKPARSPGNRHRVRNPWNDSDAVGSERNRGELLRSVGGLLFGAGALVLFIRKGGHDEWSGLIRLFVLLVPAVLLYLASLGVFDRGTARHDRGSSALLLTAAVVLGTAALFQLLSVAGASAGDHLARAAVLGLAGLLGAYGAIRARVAYAALLSGLAFLVAWLLLWEEILSHPSPGTYRWLLVAAAALLFAVAFVLMRRGAIGAREMTTVGGIAGVAAGTLGLFVSSILTFERAVTRLSSTSSAELSSSSSGELSSSGGGFAVAPGNHGSTGRHAGIVHRLSPHQASHTLNSLNGATQHLGWDIYLLVLSLALLWLAARTRSRGLGYVGGFGLLGFVISAGDEIARVTAAKPPTHSLLGWPLVLLLLGLAGLIASLLPFERTSSANQTGSPPGTENRS
jgi:hypothetical protein